jgi:hypothetical protein
MSQRAYTALVIIGVLLLAPVVLALMGFSQDVGSPFYPIAIASVALTPIYGLILVVWGMRGLMRKDKANA